MKLMLIRMYLGPRYTIGKLYVDGAYFCDTMEDVVRDVKIMHQTAIPYGTYKIILNYSNRFKRVMPRLLNVPGFDGILIHSGNTHQDTSGCLIVGDNKEVGRVINSKLRYNILFNLLCVQKDISIEIL